MNFLRRQREGSFAILETPAIWDGRVHPHVPQAGTVWEVLSLTGRSSVPGSSPVTEGA